MLQREIERVCEFNRIMGREIGNREQLYLQSVLLIQEGITELSEAIYKKDRMLLRNAVADTAVIAIGGAYICGFSERIAVEYNITCYPGLLETVAYCVACSAEVRSGFGISDVGIEYAGLIDYIAGYAEAESIDLAEDLKAVNDSNFSKFCCDEAEAMATISHYHNVHGVSAEYKQTGNAAYPIAVYSAKTKGDFIKGKLLKSINYKAPIFKV